MIVTLLVNYKWQLPCTSVLPRWSPCGSLQNFLSVVEESRLLSVQDGRVYQIFSIPEGSIQYLYKARFHLFCEKGIFLIQKGREVFRQHTHCWCLGNTWDVSAYQKISQLFLLWIIWGNKAGLSLSPRIAACLSNAVPPDKPISVHCVKDCSVMQGIKLVSNLTFQPVQRGFFLYKGRKTMCLETASWALQSLLITTPRDASCLMIFCFKQ